MAKAEQARAGQIMSAWSAARRQAASARIQAHKPWQHATGPKTVAGKSASRMNAYKHGNRSAAAIAERRAAVHYLRVQKEFLKQVRLLLRAQRALKKSSKQTNEVMTHRCHPERSEGFRHHFTEKHQPFFNFLGPDTLWRHTESINISPRGQR